MAKYLAIAKSLLIKFKQVGRDLNSHVDTLVGLTLVFKGETNWTIAVDLISIPSHEIDQESVLVSIELGSS